METIGRLSASFRRLRRKYSPRLASYMRVAYKNPRRVVLVTTQFGTEKNVWPMDWHIPLSIDPPLYGVAITGCSFGAEMIKKSGVFIVNFVPADWEDIILFCGRSSGRTVDKFREAGIETYSGRQVAAPRLCGAVGYLECAVVREVDAGDHILFVGKVLAAEESKEVRELYHETF